jgi:alpha-tubulin suppressor-like RCC1 family protein
VVNGGAQCWGYNNGGQLGTYSDAGSLVPVAVPGLGRGVQAIAVGGDYTCAVVSDGVECWGYNFGGNLGDGSEAASLTPVAVRGLGVGIQAIVAGGGHTCALVQGGVECWGDNVDGELGDNSDAGSLVPIGVLGLGSPGSGVQAIAAGSGFTCALVNGGAQCWGVNVFGQLGNNSTADSSVPVWVQGLGPGSGAQGITAGEEHTCAVVNGGVLCWGWNGQGQLGDNSTVESLVPVTVYGLGPGSGAQAVTAGSDHTCAVVNGEVLCWGSNAGGQLGNNSTAQESNVPVQVGPWAP